MWIGVTELSRLIGMTPRTIQKSIRESKVTARKRDGKSYEVDLTSLPPSMMSRLPDDMRKQAGSLTLVGGREDMILSPASQAALGRKLSPKEKQKAEVSAFFDRLDPLIREGQKVTITAAEFGISPSTVRRIIKDVRERGIIGDRVSSVGSSWDLEAIEYLQSWYLSFIKNTNCTNKQAAWNAVKAEAEKQGWKIGGRSTAYVLLAEIPPLMIRYAKAGSRALDNYFYISRDWSKLKPSQIWIGDQHICDFWVVDKSNPDKWEYYRPTLYVWEDGATRCIAGLAVDRNYTSDTVLESIRMGIQRFGFFDCTYNDNGTSECAQATTMIIDELIRLSGNRSHMMDISELYRTKDGSYVVEMPDKTVVSIDETSEEWRRKHRRIYANVKNAKAKPIERLFGTIEAKMAQRGIPGHVITPGAPADQEEKEKNLLDWWKANDMILTLEEFMTELVKGIDEYEHTWHSSLKMTPWQAVQKHIAEGWRAVRPASQEALDFLFLSRTRAKIRRGRVTVNGIDYKGEDLKVVVGKFADVGLALHDGQTVEIRYSKTDPTVAYAVLPECENSIRPLTQVRSIDMLDDDEMARAIRWKRDQMRTVREVFRNLEIPVMETVSNRLTEQVVSAMEKKEQMELPPPPPKEPPKVHVPEKQGSAEAPKYHATSFERYRWLVDKELEGLPLSEAESAFMDEYESAPEYGRQRGYWDNYRRLKEEDQA